MIAKIPDSTVFCNSPWYEIHIYWDGSFGICCQERHKLHQDDATYNIASMTIRDWFNSEPVRQFRLQMFESTQHTACVRCHEPEARGGSSRRLASNMKSVIFTRAAFEESWLQSPGRRHFDHSINTAGHTHTDPIDIHVDLGNHCNLACKMCSARASSVIASQEVQWGIESSKKYLRHDWTRDPLIWQKFITEILELKGLRNIHVMGGETLLTKRFEHMVDALYAAGRTDIGLSFVTNGTVYPEPLIEKLKRFARIGIEVSLESLTGHNAYQRQGTDTNLVLENIDRFNQHSNNQDITVTLRPAVSALTVGSYHTLLTYARDKGLIVKANLVQFPRFLSIPILPMEIKQSYRIPYENLLQQLDVDSGLHDYNTMDPHNVDRVIAEQAQFVLSWLAVPEPKDVTALRQQMVAHCVKWDAVNKLNALEIYPELTGMFQDHGY